MIIVFVILIGFIVVFFMCLFDDVLFVERYVFVMVQIQQVECYGIGRVWVVQYYFYVVEGGLLFLLVFFVYVVVVMWDI